MQHKSPSSLKISVLGAGSIGVSLSAVFADCGASVTLAEPDAARRESVAAGVELQNEAMSIAGLRHNAGGTIKLVAQAGDDLASADMVIECGPERLAVKHAIFAELLSSTPQETPLATASSAIAISQIVPDRAQQRRCLVAHPVNPPSVLRVMELVPAPGTDPALLATTAQLVGNLGFHPVTLGHEIEGFVLNRLQGAVLREAYRLVEEGVTNVMGVETIMRMGLGPRWALSGPFETAELNTPGGIRAHAARMGPAYQRMGEARGETVDWNDKLVATVAEQCRCLLPADAIPARVSWRSRALAELVSKRDDLMTLAPTDGSDNG